MAGPAVGWRTVRVFISSTFRDMQAERDYLVRLVFPRLREELLRRRIHLVDVDLRWGVTAEQDALEVCREIIDECRPRFLCILGGRYGWTPPGQERSITADEVHYAALDRLDTDEYRYFYFRDPQATESIPEDAARTGAYREFATDEDAAECGAERAEALAQERTEKLADLKQRVRDAGLPVFDYRARWDDARQRLVGLEEFGEAVYRDLLASVDDEFGEDAPAELDWFAEENAAMEAFIEERTERYVVGSRQALLDEMTAFTEGAGEPSVLVVTGEPGSGKSSLLGRFYRDHAEAHPDEIVIPHFVGASQGSASIRLTLRRLCHELVQATGIEDEIPEDVRELVQAFPEFLQRAAETGRVVLIIDALNQLDATDNAHSLNWLPRELPESVHTVCSSLEPPALEALRRRTQQVREVVCAPLMQADAAAIMDGVLARYHKRFDDAQRQALLAKQDAGNPLYLLAALEELRTLGTYELITRRIEELPGTVAGLFDWILQRLAEGVEGQEAFGEDLVSAYTSYIAIGRGGMTEDELQALCAPVDDEDEFQVLHRMLRPYLMRRGELVDYFHGQLREAVERRCLPDETRRQQRHREIAELLQSRGHGYLRTLSELPYHLTEGAEWAELDSTLTHYGFLDSKLRGVSVQGLIEDYERATAAQARPEDGGATALRLIGGAVRLSAHVLAQHPDQFPSQLWARLSGLDNRIVRAFLAAGREAAHQPWLRPLNADLSAPGGPLLRTLDHAGSATTVAVTPDGRRAVSAGGRGLTVWDLDTWTVPHTLGIRPHEGGRVGGVGVMPDGRRAVSAHLKVLKIWDLEAGGELRTLVGHTDIVNAVAVVPDGRRAVSASKDKTVKVWDLDSGEELRTLTALPRREFTAVAAMPDARRVLCAERVGPLAMWDLETGEKRALPCPDVTVDALAVTPDGRRAVSGSASDGALRVWDLEARRELITLNGHGPVFAVALTPDGRRAITGHRKTLVVWDLQTGDELRTLVGHADSVLAVAVTPDGRRAISASQDNTLKVWDLDSAAEPRPRREDLEAVNAVATTPDGRRALSYSFRTLKVWDIDSGEELRTIEAPASHFLTLAPDGRRGLFGDSSGSLMVWDLEARRELRTIDTGSGLVCMTATPDGRLALCGHSGGGLDLWDLETGDRTRTLMGPGHTVRAVAAIVGGRAVSVHSSGLKLWDLNTGHELRTIETQAVNCVAVAPDGRRAVSGGYRTICVWDLETGDELCSFARHAEEVRGLAVMADGRLVVSLAARDKTLKVWNLDTGGFVCDLTAEAGMGPCAVAPDGLTVVAGDQGGHVHFLRLENVTPGSPICTAWKAPPPRWQFWRTRAATHLAFGCPHCHAWSRVPQQALGSELPCPRCGKAVRLSPSVIEADWRPVAAAWRGDA